MSTTNTIEVPGYGPVTFNQEDYDQLISLTVPVLRLRLTRVNDGLALRGMTKFRKDQLAAMIARAEAQAKESSKRKCGCGMYIETHANGTLKRHTRYNIRATITEINSGAAPERVRCQWSGKFPPAIVGMRYDVNNRLDNRIALVTEILKFSKAENNKGLIAGCQTRLRELNAEKYPRTQIMLTHTREGSRKARKAYTRHVSGGQVVIRKRFAVTVVA